jgi:predicted ATPase
VASRGQVVSLVGAPGMGKSRLLDEFRQRLTGRRVSYAEGHCLAYANTMPYLPMLELVQAYCGIAADDGPQARIAKVRTSFQRAGLDPDARLPYLIQLLGLPTGHYMFRHILIQETAYQALLTSTRRQYHQQIAQALPEHFPTLIATQPELLAHHYTEADCTADAIAAWQRAGQQAAERSAHVEAMAHFTQALTLLQTMPATSERSQQELELQLTLGPTMVATKGPAAPEAAQTEACFHQRLPLPDASRPNPGNCALP